MEMGAEGGRLEQGCMIWSPLICVCAHFCLRVCHMFLILRFPLRMVGGDGGGVGGGGGGVEGGVRVCVHVFVPSVCGEEDGCFFLRFSMFFRDCLILI